MPRFRALLVLALVAGLGGTAGAQRRDSGEVRGAPAFGERRFRERVARVVQQRLGLSDEQLRRLQAVSRRYADERQDLFLRERALRASIRREMVDSGGADSTRQRRVAASIDEFLALQRRRVELVAAEQRDLAGFLTAFQRARYLELQEQARRRLELGRWERQHRGRRMPR